jgi:hypothetical protein
MGIGFLTPVQNLPYNKEKIINLPLSDGVSVSREKYAHQNTG